jgi:hypothetical protein
VDKQTEFRHIEICNTEDCTFKAQVSDIRIFFIWANFEWKSTARNLNRAPFENKN